MPTPAAGAAAKPADKERNRLQLRVQSVSLDVGDPSLVEPIRRGSFSRSQPMPGSRKVPTIGETARDLGRILNRRTNLSLFRS